MSLIEAVIIVETQQAAITMWMHWAQLDSPRLLATVVFKVTEKYEKLKNWEAEEKCFPKHENSSNFPEMESIHV